MLEILARVIFGIGVAGSVIGGGSLIATSSSLTLYGLIIIVVGSLLSWAVSLFLVGFGELVSTNNDIAEYAHDIADYTRDIANNTDCLEEALKARE